MNLVFAQGIQNPVVPSFTLGILISNIISVVIVLAFIASFFMFLIGGFQWITSGGNPEQVESARQRIVQSLIGLTLVIATWAIFGFIEAIFHIKFTNLPFPTLGEQ